MLFFCDCIFSCIFSCQYNVKSQTTYQSIIIFQFTFLKTKLNNTSQIIKSDLALTRGITKFVNHESLNILLCYFTNKDINLSFSKNKKISVFL